MMNPKTRTSITFALAWLLGTLAPTPTSVSPAIAQDSLDKDYSSALPRIAPSEPHVALTKFELDPSLRIETIAAEPMVIDPVAIAFDEFGRAFVVEMRGYSEQGSRKLGRIRILEDLDHDGQFDRSNIFADQFESPTAVICVRGGILVGDAPNIWFLKDTDDDRRADIRQIAFTGFGNSNIQQLFNNFQWGIDNRIYGAVGGNGGRVTPVDLTHLRSAPPSESTSRSAPAPAEKAIDLRRQDFAISLAGFQMSPITGGGQFGMTFDQWGNRFVCSNSDHCQQIILDLDDIPNNPLAQMGNTKISIAAEGPAAEVFRISPVEPWRKVRTRLRVQGLVKGPIEGGGRAAGYFTSATGITIYHGDALPDEFRGNLFVGDVGSNLIHRKKLEDTRIVKKAVRVEQNREFLRSTDNWFRPVQMANAPDGSLVILDMYRENVEHPASLPELIKKHLDLNSGNDRGRLLRIVPHDFTYRKRLLPGDANLDELVRMLDHPNGWHRQTAARLLAEGAWDRLPDLLIRQGLASVRPETRIRSMYLLANLDQLDSSRLNDLLNDSHPYVRIHALKNAGRRANHDLIQRQVLVMVDDVDLRVRFHVALILGKMETNIAPAWVRLAMRDGDYHWIQVALAASANRRRNTILKQLIDAFTANPVPEKQSRLTPGILEVTRQISLDHTSADLEFATQSLLDLLPEHASLAGEMLLQLTSGSKPQSTRLDRLLKNQHDTSLQTIVDRVTESAFLVASHPRTSLQDRTRAIQILRLSRPKFFSNSLKGLLDPKQPPEIRRETVNTAGYFSDPDIAELMLDELRSMNPGLRRQTIMTLLSREAWVQRLLNRIESGNLDPVLLESSARQRLTQHRVPAIRSAANKLLGNQVHSDRAKVLESYRTQIDDLVGEPNRGRVVFRKSCIACHRLENEGTETGPNLAAYANRGALAILTHVLDPNREVDPRYLSYSVLLEDGRTLQGIIVSENSTTVVLRNHEGKLITITRDDIEELQSSTLSLMPENLESEIPPQAMADLVEYLISQGG